MKYLLSACATVFMLATQTTSASAGTLLDDLSIIDLRASSTELNNEFNYPGLGNGRYDVPDCLALVTSTAPINYPEGALEKLVQGLIVQDGDEILFPGQNRKLNTLSATVNGNLVHFLLKDLGTYVTGIRIKTKSGERLSALVTSAFGPNGMVGLQVVRGCRTHK